MSDEYTYRNDALNRSPEVERLRREFTDRSRAILRIARGTSCPLCGSLLVEYRSATMGDPILRCPRKAHATRDPYEAFDLASVK